MTEGDALEGFREHTFVHAGVGRQVFEIGSGPAVVVLPEIPGITPGVAGFARRVADAGCTAVVVSLFGEPGRPPSAGYLGRSITRACVAKEFAAFAVGTTPPVITWLRDLAADAHRRHGGPGVGVVGMCFTGGFALAMFADPVVLAPVMSQPSLPFPTSAARRRDLGLSPDDLATVRSRAENGECVVGLRFTKDPAVPAERFARLREELGERFLAVEIDSSTGNPYGNPRMAHSVLTEHLVATPGHPTYDALTLVLSFLRERLQVATAPS